MLNGANFHRRPTDHENMKIKKISKAARKAKKLAKMAVNLYERQAPRNFVPGLGPVNARYRGVKS